MQNSGKIHKLWKEFVYEYPQNEQKRVEEIVNRFNERNNILYVFGTNCTSERKFKFIKKVLKDYFIYKGDHQNSEELDNLTLDEVLKNANITLFKIDLKREDIDIEKKTVLQKPCSDLCIRTLSYCNAFRDGRIFLNERGKPITKADVSHMFAFWCSSSDGTFNTNTITLKMNGAFPKVKLYVKRGKSISEAVELTFPKGSKNQLISYYKMWYQKYYIQQF